MIYLVIGLIGAASSAVMYFTAMKDAPDDPCEKQYFIDTFITKKPNGGH